MGTIATEAVYAEDGNGIRRLVAAAGDVIPDGAPSYGIVTPRDQPETGLEPLEGYAAMSEEDVIALLPSLDADQVKAVRAYERSHQARGSIVRFRRTSKAVDIPTPRGRKSSKPASEEFGDGPDTSGDE